MVGPTREWITIPVPGKEKRQWQVDVTFLASSWRCIFGQGCQGVLTEPAPEMIQGCCSYGAYESEKKVKEKVEKLAKHLSDDEWQFKAIGLKRRVWKSAGKDEWQTRMHEDACVFLNRPGFEAGPGCALHLHAMNTGKHFSDYKPEVSWQVPLRRIDDEPDDGSVVSRRPEFGRDGWGGGGQALPRGCTQAPEACVGTRPLYESMELELREKPGR